MLSITSKHWGTVIAVTTSLLRSTPPHVPCSAMTPRTFSVDNSTANTPWLPLFLLDAETCVTVTEQKLHSSPNSFTVSENHERKSFSEPISTENSSRLMFSMLFRNQISTQNSLHIEKYFHSSVGEHEHTCSSEKGDHMSHWLARI